MKIKYRKPYKGKAEEANEYVGDEHRPVIKTWLRLKFLSAYLTYVVHFQWMQEIEFAKHMSLAATRASHPENTGEAAHGAMIVNCPQYEVFSLQYSSSLLIPSLTFTILIIGILVIFYLLLNFNKNY